MRAISIVICCLGVAIFICSLEGQASAFYRWRSSTIGLRKFTPSARDAAEDFDHAIWSGMPRVSEWGIIRYLSLAVVSAGVGVFLADRNRRRDA